tara:strand:- start:326 stop:466 length:141 start_codon:yes stop_codon:yes gene_type:complete
LKRTGDKGSSQSPQKLSLSDWARLMPDDRDRVEYSVLGLRDKVRDT